MSRKYSHPSLLDTKAALLQSMGTRDLQPLPSMNYDPLNGCKFIKIYIGNDISPQIYVSIFGTIIPLHQILAEELGKFLTSIT